MRGIYEGWTYTNKEGNDRGSNSVFLFGRVQQTRWTATDPHWEASSCFLLQSNVSVCTYIWRSQSTLGQTDYSESYDHVVIMMMAIDTVCFQKLSGFCLLIWDIFAYTQVNSLCREDEDTIWQLNSAFCLFSLEANTIQFLCDATVRPYRWACQERTRCRSIWADKSGAREDRDRSSPLHKPRTNTESHNMVHLYVNKYLPKNLQ